MIRLTATITKLDGTLINIDYRNLVSLGREIKDRSDIELPSFGVISNGGNLKFVDYDVSIKEMIKKRELVSGMTVTIYLENTIAKAKSSLGEFLTNQWNYDNNNRQVSVRLQDDLEEWQNIEIEKKTFAQMRVTSMRPEALYQYLYNLTPSKYNMKTVEELEYFTHLRLQDWYDEIVPNFSATNLWSAWTQFCEIFKCHIYKNNKGETVCIYNRGN